EGIALFQSKADLIDVVLLDLSMPGMSGEEAFYAFRALRGDLRVVLSSGYMGDEASQRIIAHSRVSQLKKPYSRKELVAAVDEFGMDDAAKA
ncbi:MAG TPA: response regulator, partial [Myxococcales bacterium]|nr:response regulator [Myxococcales bacterium]